MEEALLRNINLIALCVAALLSHLVLHITERKLPVQRRWLRLLASYALCYLLIAGLVNVVDTYITWRFDTFDLNADGIISPGEVTDPSAEYLMKLEIQDTARTFIPFTAILFALFATVFGFVVDAVRRTTRRVIGTRA